MSADFFQWQASKVNMDKVVSSVFFDCCEDTRNLLPLLTAIVAEMTLEQQINIAKKLGWSYVK